MRGEILARASRYSEAEAAFEKASSELGRALTLPQQLSALTGLADAQIARGANDMARSTLQRMRKLAGDTAQARLIAARLALVAQDYAGAVSELQPVVTAMPNFGPARFLLGAALLAQGNHEQAESHLSALVADDSRKRRGAQAPGQGQAANAALRRGDAGADAGHAG